ncbi:MAG TPA: YicC/YloC family endoribonuclease [Longimicrobiales bacterium]|nr:YicC/YloC family endoribonuclease [Longimicrobiales bacterium]
MIRSMTGYGEAERDTPSGRLRVEIRSVNHRYFSANLKLPSALERFEPQVRDWVREQIPRGHVSITIRLQLQENGSGAPRLRPNEERARQYLEALIQLREALGVGGDVDIALLSRFGDIFERVDEESIPVDPELLREVVTDAALATVAMREREGASLRNDLEERLAAIEASLAEIVELAPARLVRERDRMRKSIAALLDDVAIDEERIAREVAHMADRWDISEEVVRLRSHIEAFRAMLSDSGEPVGKRLGFLVQEMHREANTIGSKSNDSAIDHRVVAIKNEIERLREQIENVE